MEACPRSRAPLRITSTFDAAKERPRAARCSGYWPLAPHKRKRPPTAIGATTAEMRLGSIIRAWRKSIAAMSRNWKSPGPIALVNQERASRAHNSSHLKQPQCWHLAASILQRPPTSSSRSIRQRGASCGAITHTSIAASCTFGQLRAASAPGRTRTHGAPPCVRDGSSPVRSMHVSSPWTRQPVRLALISAPTAPSI